LRIVGSGVGRSRREFRSGDSVGTKLGSDIRERDDELEGEEREWFDQLRKTRERGGRRKNKTYDGLSGVDGNGRSSELVSSPRGALQEE